MDLDSLGPPHTGRWAAELLEHSVGHLPTGRHSILRKPRESLGGPSLEAPMLEEGGQRTRSKVCAPFRVQRALPDPDGAGSTSAGRQTLCRALIGRDQKRELLEHALAQALAPRRKSQGELPMCFARGRPSSSAGSAPTVDSERVYGPKNGHHPVLRRHRLDCARREARPGVPPARSSSAISPRCER